MKSPIIITSPKKMQELSLALRAKQKTIGIVPTMGFLHEGHESLIKASVKKCDVTILTIFVNPSQFGPNEDLSRYPRDEKSDIAMATKNGVDYVFLPTPQTMYPEGYETYVEVGSTASNLCGEKRPGHFRGVDTIVLKLFNITQPHYAFFGKKDFQQLAVIKRMVLDFNLPVQIIGLPTIREKDGLAKSSRNVYLSAEERVKALCISGGLKKIAEAVKGGFTNVDLLTDILETEISKHPDIRIDYIACMDADTILPITQYKKNKTLFAMACFLGKTRLIDNVVV